MTTPPVNSTSSQGAIELSEVPLPPAPPERNPPHELDSIEIRESSCMRCVGASAHVAATLLKTVVSYLILPFVWVGNSLVDLCNYLYARVYVSLWTHPLDSIPISLENDELFTQHICCVHELPIRFPVYDRRHPQHIYEKSVILECLAKRKISPLSGEPMTEADLVPHVVLQAQIEKQLHKFHKE